MTSPDSLLHVTVFVHRPTTENDDERTKEEARVIQYHDGGVLLYSKQRRLLVSD